VQAGFSVLTPSRPGYGRTPLDVGGSGDQAAEALIALLDCLQVPACSVIAISRGGPTGISLAAKYPQRVQRLVLVAAVSRPEVCQYAQFLTMAESVKNKIEGGVALSPHKDVDLSWYPSDLERGLAQLLANTNNARFDGSDMMPGPVGAGTFLSGIVDFVDGVDLDTILANIWINGA
jgi:pimeloyl-ACP methyl ester carboxylesterase